MPQCAVVGCNSTHRKTKGGSIRYHRFPGDAKTRARWLQACGKQLNNCSTARICSRHFSEDSYERDVQHEILGLPTRCRLKKGAVPEKNLPTDFLKEEEVQESAIAILLAVGLVPTANPTEKISGGLPQDLNKMQIMEDVREGCNVQPSSPGHAEQRADDDSKKTETHSENGFEEQNSNTNHEENNEDQKEDTKTSENEVDAAESNKTEFSEANNEENYSNDSAPSVEGNKRKCDTEDFPIKRLRTEIHQNFVSRDKILNEFIEMAECNNLEQIHTFSEQLLAEIKTLNELAKEKEREWNNILHLKKIKEELLLRMQRKRQIMLINEKSDYSDLLSESQSDNADERSKSGSPHSILKSNLTNPQKSALRIPSVSLNGDKSKHRTILPKLPQNTLELNGSLDLRQAKQRPILDVQSIIADYRQRHPEAVPRRGRRIRNSQTDGSNKSPSNVLNFASMTLGSGSQVRQNLQGVDMNSEFGMLLSSMNGNRSDYSKASNSDSSTMQDTTSFRDMLLQFAKLSQSERTELMQNFKPPPPYPEVTVHPVPTTTAAPTNSLLHGILTKSPSKQNTKTSFSPTLARLLTAPERAVSSNPTTSTPTMSSSTTIHPSNMSISEILSTSKARNEITITPVGTQYETTPSKARSTEEEEAEDSADRLVIDESNEAAEARRAADNNSDGGDEVPPCQGCNQKPAQFVCAGCGNQWYCSRDCQVAAWDEHSEVCSG
ncbi:uncharacterized protein LOC108907960 isoform X3 [Anoplophora glabripennis]|uniref:uncharacterized protein LOC108907960 isoform X3 n=1 Tax=Anoplophora glabripennis TaxID=217634 RepID=UPI0008758FBA|nr:uncharacterized protein LOC108907960 isoform X3 [Anoplophora glabripennis]